MERCPHCGTPGRPGAKFCTTCGYRFPDAEGDAGEPQPKLEEHEPDDTLFAGSAARVYERNDGDASWPSGPTAAELYLGSGWEPDLVSVNAVAEEPVDPWPAPPSPSGEESVATPTNPHQVDAEPQPVDADADLVTAEDEQSAGADATLAEARVSALLDELRDAITALPRETGRDLSGVVSDLEVAVTPPGAMAPDDVAELREALLAARERPRDVDTIVDLTKRIEAMLSLVIAYDRTIAAIERSLEVLRIEGDGVME